MKKILASFVQKYDSATVFVGAATIVIVIELALMRLLVPQTSSETGAIESGFLMNKVFDISNVEETTTRLETWEQESSQLIGRLSSQTYHWQKDLVTIDCFGQKQSAQETNQDVDDELAEQMAVADYAANQLYLQSIMTGRIPLANINGKIYRIGDDIPIRGGEILMTIVELGSDYAVVQLLDAADIERTIYLTRDPRMASGLQVP